MWYVGFEIELLGLVTDSERKILRSLSATKPSRLISKPSDMRMCEEVGGM